MIEQNVLVRHYIGHRHMSDKAIDPSGFGTWSNTLKHIKEQMAISRHDVSSEEIKANIHKNRGYEYSVNYTDSPCNQIRFEIFRTGGALNAQR